MGLPARQAEFAQSLVPKRIPEFPHIRISWRSRKTLILTFPCWKSAGWICPSFNETDWTFRPQRRYRVVPIQFRRHLSAGRQGLPIRVPGIFLFGFPGRRTTACGCCGPVGISWL